MSDNASTSVAASFDGPYNAEDQGEIDGIVTEAYDTAAAAASVPDTDLPGEWSDGQKRDFRKMPSSQQNYYAGATRQLKDQYAPHAELNKKWSAHTAQFGASPAQADEHLLNVDLGLRNANPQQRAAMIASLVTEYGIDPTDPAFMEAAARVVEGKSQHQAGHDSAMAEVDMAHHQQRQAQVQQTIAEFADAKDESGNLLRPDFAQHETKMAELANTDIAAGKKPTIDDLYHRASGRERVARAKAANGSITGAGGGSTPPRNDDIKSIVAGIIGG